MLPSPRHQSPCARCRVDIYLAIVLLLVGRTVIAIAATDQVESQECAAVAGTVDTNAITAFLQTSLAPAAGMVELRFEETEGQDSDEAGADEEATMASRMDQFDHARIARCRERRQAKTAEDGQEAGDEMTMLAMPFPVFYINMDKSVDRRRRMERNFGHLWDLRRFPAVDGRNMTLVESLVAPEDYRAILPHIVDEKKRPATTATGTATTTSGGRPVAAERNTAQQAHNHPADTGGKGENKTITPILRSELGASLSHLMAIRQAYLEGHEVVMIAEDDLSPVLTPCWTSPIFDLVKDVEAKAWSIIQLSWLVVKDKAIYHTADWGPNRRLVAHPNQYGAAAYLISRAGMEGIVDRFFTDRTATGLVKVFAEPDSWKNIVVETYLGKLPNCYVSMPSLFLVETHDTTIGSGRGSNFRLQSWRLSNLQHISATLKLFDAVMGPAPDDDDDEEKEEEEEEEEEEVEVSLRV
jgi:GR25 family glycosyltransferase involved in LPS biosynthesis